MVRWTWVEHNQFVESDAELIHVYSSKAWSDMVWFHHVLFAVKRKTRSVKLSRKNSNMEEYTQMAFFHLKIPRNGWKIDRTLDSHWARKVMREPVGSPWELLVKQATGQLVSAYLQGAWLKLPKQWVQTFWCPSKLFCSICSVSVFGLQFRDDTAMASQSFFLSHLGTTVV